MKGRDTVARPAMSSKVTAKHLTKAEIDIKTSSENKLKGASDSIQPPSYLSASQKEIFNYIVDNLDASGILGNLDIYVLTECSICIDRMQEIETEINNSGKIIPSLVRLKESYTKAFFRYCNELSLSPQSRAKLANINLQAAAEENPLVKALQDDE